MSRKFTREHVFKFLYSYNFNKELPMEELLADYFDKDIAPIEFEVELAEIVEDKKYFCDVAHGVAYHLNTIDEMINNKSISWDVERMPRVDLSILRLAIFEILYKEEIPNAVSANEAIELAKKYGTADSSKFVNGVLGNIITEITANTEK